MLSESSESVANQNSQGNSVTEDHLTTLPQLPQNLINNYSSIIKNTNFKTKNIKLGEKNNHKLPVSNNNSYKPGNNSFESIQSNQDVLKTNNNNTYHHSTHSIGFDNNNYETNGFGASDHGGGSPQEAPLEDYINSFNETNIDYVIEKNNINHNIINFNNNNNINNLHTMVLDPLVETPSASSIGCKGLNLFPTGDMVDVNFIGVPTWTEFIRLLKPEVSVNLNNLNLRTPGGFDNKYK
jgi:hypothetical protein